MAKVQIRNYCSPTLCLLVFDWAEGFKRPDFLGFAIKRTPGFRSVSTGRRAAFSWLPNRISFNGPMMTTTGDVKQSVDFPSNEAPVQKFEWWDARIDTQDRGSSFEYEVIPVAGKPDALQMLDDSSGVIKCEIPELVTGGIGTYFNRAVVSSQAFMQRFGHAPTGQLYHQALAWLSNGMNDGISDFIAASDLMSIVAYHLTDEEWVLPTLNVSKGGGEIVYYLKQQDPESLDTQDEVQRLKQFKSFPRTHTSIMHDKYIVRLDGDRPISVLTGSANFTTGGLTSQANVMHTFDSEDLAALYYRRARELAEDPEKKELTPSAKWSDPITVGDASIRVIFSPESAKKRLSLDQIVDTIQAAKTSVFFCLFDVTDKAVIDACFDAGNKGLLLRGLVNEVTEPSPTAKDNAQTTARVRLYNRAEEQGDVVGHSSFGKSATPNGFWWEASKLPVPGADGSGGKGVPTVYVHHKFIVVDGESDKPIIYVGSQNLSNNSVHNNDENLLEISGDTALGQAYVAEFMRLFEQYRARADFEKHLALANHSNPVNTDTFRLTPDSSWAAKYFKSGTPEFRMRTTLG